MKNNKGFSLVELIVVIAIMAVLVGVLAPQFIKYVESSRRSTDVSNAESIRSAVLADIADGKITSNKSSQAVASSTLSTLKEAPKVRGKKTSETQFKFNCNVNKGTCSVYIGTYNLSLDSGISEYKDQTND